VAAVSGDVIPTPLKKNKKEKEVSLEVNTEKTKYLLMSCHQNAGQNHNIKIINESFENLGMFKYFGTTVNQNLFIRKLRAD
jgi:hypothetical protein